MVFSEEWLRLWASNSASSPLTVRRALRARPTIIVFSVRLRIGFNGIFCFSTYALTLATQMGFLIAGASFLLMAVYLFFKVMGWTILWGNPTLVILISFLGGVQLISVGILGEYIGRIYEEVRDRPRFIVDSAVGFEDS